MRARVPTLACALLLVAGCPDARTETQATLNPANPKIESVCDKDALTALSRELEAASGAALGNVWPALEAACGDSLSEAARIVYAPTASDHSKAVVFGRDDKPFTSQRDKACPSWSDVAPAVANVAAPERGTVVFKGCGFARYDVITLEEAEGTTAMVTWATHQWLLDQGLEASTVKPITRALYALERRRWWLNPPVPGQTWPVARGVPLQAGVAVSISADALTVLDHKLRLDGGAIEPSLRRSAIDALYDPLAEAADARKAMAAASGDEAVVRMLIAADAKTPMATVVEVLRAAATADFDAYAVLVQSGSAFDLAQVPLFPPELLRGEKRGIWTFREEPLHRPEKEKDETPSDKRFAGEEGKMGKPTAKRKLGLYAMKGPEDAIPQMAQNFDPGSTRQNDLTAVLTIEVDGTEYSLRYGGLQLRGDVKVPIGDHAAIAAQARALKTARPDAHRVFISAAPEVSLEQVVAVMAAARGPDCTAEGTGCVLKDVVLRADDAHAFRPRKLGDPFAAGSDDVNVWGHRRGRRVSRVRQGEATVKGALDKDIIRRIVRAHINDVGYCYDTGLAGDPKLDGEVSIEFVVDQTTKVTSSAVKKSSLKDEQVGLCIAKAAKGWRFPGPRGGGTLTVVQPFVLSPK